MKKPLSKRHELIVNMPYVLLKLLIEYNALSSYVDNTIPFRVGNEIKNFIQRDSGTAIISESFVWRYSKEGWHFWRNIEIEYCKRLWETKNPQCV